MATDAWGGAWGAPTSAWLNAWDSAGSPPAPSLTGVGSSSGWRRRQRQEEGSKSLNQRSDGFSKKPIKVTLRRK